MSSHLINKVFISTRHSGQNEELRNLLEKEGACLVEMPTIEIKSADVSESEINLLKSLDQFSWIVFTSPNGIRFFFEKLKELNGNYKLQNNIKTAVVGKKTSEVLAKYGYKATIQNPGNTSVELGTKLWGIIGENDHLLFPEGNIALGTIAKMLSRIAKCTNLVIYQNVYPKTIDKNVLQRIINDEYENIIITSPSSYINLVKAIGKSKLTSELRIACIGSTTANALISDGLRPTLTAKMSNSEGIFEELVNHFRTI